jgi:phosphocarrier protein HPr
MLEQEFTIVNKLGLHARAAAQFVRLASSFGSQIKLQKDTQKVDAKSIMSVMLLAAGKGSLIQLNIQGDDEQEAMQKLGALIEAGFGED